MGGPIAKQYKEVLQIFNKLCTLVQSPGHPYSDQIKTTAVLDELGRLKVWAGNIGAHQVGRVSLDYRLRDASHIQRQVIQLLEDLREALEDAVLILSGEKAPYSEESSDSELSDAASVGEIPRGHRFVPEIKQRFLDIVEIIACLFKLSIAIRSPAPHDRLVKSAKIKLPHFEPFDVGHAVEKFPGADRDLIRRLGLANVKRREQFEYRKRHHEKLVGSEPGESDYSPKEQAQAEEEQEQTSAESKKRPSTITTTAYTQSTAASTLHQRSLVRDLENIEIVSDTSQSHTSYTPSVADDEQHRIKVPPLPEEAADEKPFECPYCYTICIFKGHGRFWKNHVFKDLQPYLCTFSECPTNHKMFLTRREWFNHELRVHRREWLCSICGRVFKTKDEFEQHIRHRHPDGLLGSQLSALVDMCERPVENLPAAACPLCDWDTIWRKRRADTGQSPFSDVIMVTARTFQAHVGRHLEELALFALPKIFNEEASDMDSDRAEASLGSSDPRGALSLISEAPPYRQREIIIAVMGVTGMGKTSFINQVTGENLLVGHGLDSCTKNIEFVPTIINGQLVTLVDTPGFDESYEYDAEVLTLMGLWLKREHDQNRSLGGIIYLHRIPDLRIGSTMMMLNVAKKMCGPGAFKNVALTTTMWDRIRLEEGEQRQTELITSVSFWGDMIQGGAKAYHYGEDNYEIPKEIVMQLLSEPLVILDIQAEMSSNGGIIGHTLAGHYLKVALESHQERYYHDLAALPHDGQPKEQHHMERAGGRLQERYGHKLGVLRRDWQPEEQYDMDRIRERLQSDVQRTTEAIRILMTNVEDLVEAAKAEESKHEPNSFARRLLDLNAKLERRGLSNESGVSD